MSEEAPAQEPRKSLRRRLRVLLWGFFFVIVLILGLTVFVSISGYRYNHHTVVQRVSEGKIHWLESLLVQYKHLGGMYPSNEQGLMALNRRLENPTPARWVQLVRVETDLLDPWGNKFLYRHPGIHNPRGFDVFTAGADGVRDTEDDIGNWEIEP
ncbi:MAG: type II secretion system protein GspG [Verrucomicrobiaceae bacterium]|nr:type II secretion system protein GspG [Verrucomicrobiaceae bacterium]